jgi:AIPR protein
MNGAYIMGDIEVGHIRDNCLGRFDALIDKSDLVKKGPNDIERNLLSRSLAAFAIADLAGVGDEVAADSVVDEGGDDGIDAFYYDPSAHRTYLVQAKWSKDGKETIDVASVLKFTQGFRHVIAPKHHLLGPKLRRKDADIKAALRDIKNHFVLVVAYTGEKELSSEAKVPFEDLTTEVNRSQEWASVVVLRQPEIHKMVASRSLGNDVTMDVLLHEYGSSTKPYCMYYGQVSVGEVATWAKYADRLYDRNLRQFKGSTEVNDDIIHTLQKNPERFLYFNNGITIVSTEVNPKPYGLGTPIGMFTCTGASVVNGAQTVGSIIRAHESSGFSGPSTARVLVRLVSLRDCPAGFGDQLTRAANTQNRVEKRDFAAQDAQQDRLMRELLLSHGKRYIYKPGEADTPGQPDSCTIDEAAIALACAHPNISYCMTAKREVSKLYDDINKAPYTALFNPSLRALKMWRCVQIMRSFDEHLRVDQADPSNRIGLFAIHGHRFILHLVFRLLGDEALSATVNDEELSGIISKLKETADELLRKVEIEAERSYKSTYAGALFKNLTKCRSIADKVLGGADEKQQLLFGEVDK